MSMVISRNELGSLEARDSECTSLMKVIIITRGGKTYFRVMGPKGNFLDLSMKSFYDLIDLLDDFADYLSDGEATK